VALDENERRVNKFAASTGDRDSDHTEHEGHLEAGAAAGSSPHVLLVQSVPHRSF
jgi:hypothetical protein